MSDVPLIYGHWDRRMDYAAIVIPNGPALYWALDGSLRRDSTATAPLPPLCDCRGVEDCRNARLPAFNCRVKRQKGFAVESETA